MGEVDQLEDPVDQGEPDGAERVDRAEGEPVEPRLGDRVEPVADDQGQEDGHDDQDSPDPGRSESLLDPLADGGGHRLGHLTGLHGPGISQTERAYTFS